MKAGLDLLWIVTTQWRAQALGRSGDPNASTPVLDRLAAEGVEFRQAVTPHPFGPFARAALLTGVESPRNGVGDYYDPLPPEVETIAPRLKRLGYTTAYFGKWHLGPKDKGVPLVGEAHARTIVPENRRGGFDFWEGFEGGFQLVDPWLHGTRLPEPVRISGYQSSVLCDRAAEYLAQSSHAPRFCVVSLEPPHPPYDLGPGPQGPREIALRRNVPTTPEVRERATRELRGYYRHIAATDAAVGRLLRPTDPERTAVFFTSVHGDMHGSHGLFRKGWPYEESVRVPLLLKGPGLEPSISDAPLSLSDLPELTLQLANGGEFRVERSAAAISMPSVVELADQCDRSWSGYRSPAEKLVVNRDGSPWLYFDLVRDPYEMRNLAGDPLGEAAVQAALEKLSQLSRSRG